MSKTGVVLIFFFTIVGFVKADVAKRLVGSFHSTHVDLPHVDLPHVDLPHVDLPHVDILPYSPSNCNIFGSITTGCNKEKPGIQQVQVVRCGAPPEIDHGIKSCTKTGSFGIGDTCFYSCKTGYSMSGGATVTCLGSSGFSNSPQCKAVECPSLPNIGNGFYQCPRTTHTYGDSCNVICSRGYKAKSSLYITCQADRTWTTPTSCELVPCSAPPNPSNGIYNCSTSSLQYGGRCNLICSRGYTPDNTVTYTRCQADQTWSTSAQCKSAECLSPPNIPNGNFHCPRTTYTYGDTCDIICSHGYTAMGSSFIKCQADKTWTTPTTCERVRCSPPKIPTNGTYNCVTGSQHYGDTCNLTCSSGYTPDSHDIYIKCQADQTWSTSAKCIDNTPPRFDNCPIFTKTVYTDRGLNYKNVTWVKPNATDPLTGLPANVVLKSPRPPGSMFEQGEHVITYHAYDDAGNRAICSFKISVETIHCSAPNLHPNSSLMVYGCKEYIYGTVCPVSCQPGYPLGGPDHIVCEKDNSYPPVASWKWNETSGIKPYCMVRPCSNLTAPENGALACDKWMSGMMCQMQCNSKYDLPISAPSDGMFACGTGTWKPSNKVPDCVSKNPFSSMSVPSSVSYNGSCPRNSVTQQQIKENFIKSFDKSIYSSGSCSKVLGCKTENVQVICGKVTRNLHLRDSEDTVTIKFDVVVAYDGSTASGSAALNYNFQRLHEIADSIKKMAENGSLSMEKFGLKLDKATVNVQSAHLGCPAGRITDMRRGSCVGCPKGFSLNATQKSCTECPVGSYQDKTASAACTQCPQGMSTSTTGSTSMSDCHALCSPGLISPDGLEPCSPCPMGSYQMASGKHQCISCSKGMVTHSAGSTKSEDCLGFDIAIEDTVIFKPTTKSLDKLTFASWLYLYKDVTESFNMATWQDPKTAMVSMKVVLRQHVEITINGSTAKTNIQFPLKQWIHFALEANTDTGDVSLYLNGQLSAKQHMSMTGALIPQGQQLVIKPIPNGNAVFSRLVVFDDVVSGQIISDLAKTCVTYDSPHMMDLTDIDMNLSVGAQYIIPSMCQ